MAEPYLNVLEGIRHHSYEHINENYDSHSVVSHKEELPHMPRERLHVSLSDRWKGGQSKQWPKQGHVTGQEAEKVFECVS